MISQREAKRLKKRVKELEEKLAAQHRSWTADWPGIHLDTIEVKNAEWHIIRTARKLGHSVVLVPTERTNEVHVYGSKL